VGYRFGLFGRFLLLALHLHQRPCVLWQGQAGHLDRSNLDQAHLNGMLSYLLLYLCPNTVLLVFLVDTRKSLKTKACLLLCIPFLRLPSLALGFFIFTRFEENGTNNPVQARYLFY